MTSRERLAGPAGARPTRSTRSRSPASPPDSHSLPPVRPMTGHPADLGVLTDYRDRW